MRKLRQWTLNHPLQFVSVFMLVYFTWFSLLEKYAQPVLMIHSKLDDKIPFCEYFIVPYLLWFVWIAGTFVYFYIKSRDDFYHACRYMFTGMIVCLIIYTLIPNGLNLRPEITKTGRHDLVCGYGNECLPVDPCVQQYCNQYGYPAFQCL